MTAINLASLAWTVRPIGDPPAAARRPGTLPARVPGCVHLDLIRAGVIRHPDRGDAEKSQAWVGECDWEYACTFDVPANVLAHPRVDLVFEGLDTIAEIELNGEDIGSAASMFIEHRFDVRTRLRAAGNTLVVRLRSPLRHARAQRLRLGDRPANGDWEPFNFIRKPACNFRWDFAPQVPTVGICKPARIEGWSGARVRTVRPLVMRAEAGMSELHVAVDLETEAKSARVIAACAGVSAETTASANGSALLTLQLPGLPLWWPRGYGAQALHHLEVAIDAGAGPRSAWSGRVGLRTVEIARDGPGAGGLTLRVNGRDTFCQGANWVPPSLFPTEAPPSRIRALVSLAADANMNMLRVWGGGTYESQDFYRACDELGVMVWQDFMFACAMYPEEEPLCALVQREAREQVARLSQHPSVVLWCGGNETVWGWQKWGWRERLAPGQSWGARYWIDMLPRVVADLNPTTPYWPNSPWSGSLDADALDPDRGDRHTWDAELDGYRALVPRFLSEFGRQGPPNHSTLVSAIGEGELSLERPAFEHRQRAAGGSAIVYQEALSRTFPTPRSFDRWHYQAQVLQARAIGIGLRWCRVHRPTCGGVLVWQHNDCWTAHSWSLIDAALRAKPAWHEARRALAPIMTSIEPMNGAHAGLSVCVVNDADDALAGMMRVQRTAFDGTVLAHAEFPARVPPRGAAVVGDVEALVGPADDPARECIVAEGVGGLFGERAVWFHLPDKGLHYPPATPRVTTRATPEGTLVHVEAASLLRDGVLAADRLAPGAAADSQLLTLFPGENADILVRGWLRGNAAAIVPPVLQFANSAAKG